MTLLDKIKIALLSIITFGFIWIWINKKQVPKNKLTVESKVKVNIAEIIKAIGKDNITEITNTRQRVKISFKNKKQVKKENIENLKGISGTIFSSTSVSLVVGNSAAEVAKQLKNNS
ncbi:PTS glucose transporter subunit IIB [Mycoplasma marinum]|uniref:PTS glucose transporter subunit IIB n=1 Tax=Mycoplasma marinum TaxID=1937190 RepID=A0A4R0XNZ7_9MOLU|nr:PTS glucose transporter subunit IIB [Mycoplasma marinum]TCG10685.1 PTS glucose transporter subunit IIB [Mycoplasma marinum]